MLQHGNRQNYIYDMKQMTALGESCSRFERRAELATRDAADWLKCEYLQKHVGNEYSGIVTSVTSFGLFVQLEDFMIDGLVHVTSLKRDYYHFDAVHHRLVGEKTGRSYQLGDQVQVQVMRVDMEEKRIDFDLISSTSARFVEGGVPGRKDRNKERAAKPKTKKNTTGKKSKTSRKRKRKK
jgi:ribonuclease R